MKVRPESFVRFIYPFLFDAETFVRRAERISAAEYAPGQSLWEVGRFAADGMLPHAADYLNPPPGMQPTAQLWRAGQVALQAPAGLGATANNIHWRMVINNQEIPFQIKDFQLALFRLGVGFLSCRLQVSSDSPDDWFDALHYFRFLRRKQVSVAARRQSGWDEQNKQPVLEKYFPPLAIRDEEYPHCFAGVLNGLLHSARLDSDAPRWWRDVFIAHHALPYAGIFLEDAPEENDPELLFRFHNFFHSKQEIFPAPQELQLDGPHLLPYAQRQWWVFSLDGGAFVACQSYDTEFFRNTLPDHLDGQYLILYLLALHQRFSLMGLSDQVSRHWLLPGATPPGADNDDREETFRRIRDTMLSFTARGYFAQVMQRRHHHRCYQRWLEVFQIQRLYDEVSHEVRDMHEHLVMKKTAHVERLALWLNVIATIAIPPALVLGMLDAVGNISWSGVLLGLVLGLVIGFNLSAWLFWSPLRSRLSRIRDCWRAKMEKPRTGTSKDEKFHLEEKT